jgi:hypothetical protein
MLYLKRNLPSWERTARLVLATTLAALTWAFASGLAAWAGWLAVASLALTAVAGFCPACAMVGRRAVGD